jgi:chaperonin GroES
MKFQPLGDRVLVQPIKEGEQEVGGIIIPDSAKEKPQQGKVKAIGIGAKDEDGKPKAFNVKVGDTVLLPKYGGTEIKLDGETYQILREDDILGVLN